MIQKSEILELATQASLLPHVIEKDYVLGWLLAGIYQHDSLRENWVFKGGTCLKKCYFETYRFSEDLDFTLRDASHVNEAFLREVFTGVAEWIYSESGIEIPAERLSFEIYSNPRDIASCQGRVYYRGPFAGFSSKNSMPRIKLDLSADEALVEDPVMMPVRHDYSDCPEAGFSICSYSYVEIFAEKIRALKERTRPRDLYDVINFFRRPESREVAADVTAVLKEKCDFKSIEFPKLADLDQHREVCAAGWDAQLRHQLQVLPPFESYWGELPSFFAWLASPDAAQVSQLSAIPSPYDSGATDASLESGSPYYGALDRVRFAAVNRLCVELDYRKENGQRSTYLIEPYSLRTTSQGNTILYGVKLPTGEIRGFRTDRIIGASITQQPFAPRYSIDFIPDGPVRLGARRVTSTSLMLPRSSSFPPVKSGRKKATRSVTGAKHVFQCSVCGKQFTRSSYDSRLNTHKNKQGLPCYGRTGVHVRTKY